MSRGPRVKVERLPDGRTVEVFRGGPKVRVEQVSPDRSDVHRELKGERIIHETIPGEDVQEWAESLGRESERGKVDGTITYDDNTPRRSQLAAELADAGMTAADLAQRTGIPAPRLERHLAEETIPDPQDRQAVERVLPDAFPVVVASASELIGGQNTPTNPEVGKAAEAAASERSKRRDQFARERAAAVQRRQRQAAQRRRDLDTGLSRVASRIDNILERLNR